MQRWLVFCALALALVPVALRAEPAGAGLSVLQSNDPDPAARTWGGRGRHSISVDAAVTREGVREAGSPEAGRSAAAAVRQRIPPTAGRSEESRMAEAAAARVPRAGGALPCAPDPAPHTGDATDKQSLAAVRRLLDPFLAESLPGGGIDAAKSPWQKPGTGSASGSDLFPGGVDVRYLRFLVEALYRVAALTGERRLHDVADAHVRFLAAAMKETHPTWALGNALELIGVYHCYNPCDEGLVAAARRIVEWARRRKVTVTTADGVTLGHFPCGYGVQHAKDAGWTNDLSMLGSGLVWAYELTGDRGILEDAASFAEYFLQPWRAGAVGKDGFWECGTWREDLGSWVIGPAHFTGFESTGAYGDETSWVFSTRTCIDFLLKLQHHRPDSRLLDRCLKAAQWTFRACQFEDGAVGMCGRDDRWLGFAGDALTQVAMLRPYVQPRPKEWAELRAAAERSRGYLGSRLPGATIEGHGVEWVTRKTSTDPLCNVAMLWASALVGWLDGRLLGTGPAALAETRRG